MEVNGKHLLWVLNKIHMKLFIIVTFQLCKHWPIDISCIYAYSSFQACPAKSVASTSFSVAPGCANTKMQLRRAERSLSGRFLLNEFVSPAGNTMPMCCSCISVYLTLIRVATLPRTIWTGPRIQRTRIDAILKVGATDSCAHRLSPVHMADLNVLEILLN